MLPDSENKEHISKGSQGNSLAKAPNAAGFSLLMCEAPPQMWAALPRNSPDGKGLTAKRNIHLPACSAFLLASNLFYPAAVAADSFSDVRT